MGSISASFGRFLRTAAAVVGLTAMTVAGGAVRADAVGTPAFNNTASDYPTVFTPVTVNGQTTPATTVNARVGDTITIGVWDHQTNPDAIATNVVVKAALPTVVANSHAVTGLVAASNAAAATGSVSINVGGASRLTYQKDSLRMQMIGADGRSWVPVNLPAGMDGNNIVTPGGLVFDNQPGCWQNARLFYFDVKVEGGSVNIMNEKKVQLVGGSLPYGSSANAQPGDEVAFSIAFENTGNSTGHHSLITDQLDSRLQYVPGSTFVRAKQNNQDVDIVIPDDHILFENNGQKLTWAYYDMAPGAENSIFLYFKAKVAGSFPAGQNTAIQNCANTRFDEASKDTNCVTVNVNVPTQIGFTLRKEVTNRTLGDSKWYTGTEISPAAPGDTVSYRLIVQNTGNTAAANVTLRDILPAGVTYLGNAKLYEGSNPNATPVAIDASSLVTANGYTFSSIANGSGNIKIIVFDAKVTDQCGANSTLTNVAKVFYGGQQKAQDQASILLSCTRSLIIKKQVKDPETGQFVDQLSHPVKEGQQLTYRIFVTNNGSSLLTNVIARDVLPSTLAYVPGSFKIDNTFQNTTEAQSFFTPVGVRLTDLKGGLGKVIEYDVLTPACPPLGDTPALNKAFVKADTIAEIMSELNVVIRVQRPTILPF